MFNFKGKAIDSISRKESTLKKVERLRKSAKHEEPDRIPVGEFFWSSFSNRWRNELNLPADANPYYHYDLDWIVVNPNMDPHIKSFETIFEDDSEVRVVTGYEVVMRKKLDFPMPEMMSWN
ncbi:MAG: hypothetical protein MI892_04965, partial [Desulfobacterales bacterium]|nr:hypothetical protein [Desulfobacterales bacterium]